MARGPQRRVEALVLDRTRLGEADLILTLLSSEGALLRAVAKGARRPASRLAPVAELYGRVDALLAPGKSLWILTDGRRLRPPARMGGDVCQLAAAATVAEAVRAVLPEGEEDPYSYALVRRSLEVLADPGASPDPDAAALLVAGATVLKLLSHLGWRPGLEACVGCGDPAVRALSVAAGGVLCEACAAELGDGAADAGGIPSAATGAPEPLDGQRLAWLRSLLSARLADLARAPVDPATAAWLASWVHLWASYHLDTRLRAFSFLLSF